MAGNKSYFSFCPYEIDSPEEAYRIVEPKLKADTIVRIDKMDDVVYYTEFIVGNSAIQAHRDHYIYEVLDNGGLHYITSNTHRDM